MIPCQTGVEHSENLYRLLVESVVDYAIYMVGLDGRVATWNPGAARIKGYAAEEVIGQPFAMFFTEEDRRLGRPEQALAAARKHGRFESEGWRVRKDGSLFWALAVVDAVYGEGGDVIGFAKITRDMTERYAAQQTLVESERRFRLLVQGVTDYAIFMLDRKGHIVNWNSGAQRIKGYRSEEIIGQHFSRFYTDDDKTAGGPKRALAEAERNGRFEAEGWRVRKDGSLFWANVIIDAIREEDGNLVGFAKITRDLTERRESQRALEEMRAQLAQAQKLEALGQLTGGVAHDFNNVLQVILAGLAVAEKLPSNSSSLAPMFAEMRMAATRANDLTKRLLAFSRRAPLRPEVADISKVIRDAAGMIGRTLNASISLDLQIEEDVSPVRIDTSDFEIALLNLAVNARDAMPQGGTLRIGARNVELRGKPDGLVGPFVAVSVRDTGVGIPEEVLSRIFEPFFTTKPLGKGTGLGLSQVHGFAQQAGGAVTVSSEADKGTEFTLWLRASSAAEYALERRAADQGLSQAGALAKPLCVLVVDDDPGVSRLTVGMLEAEGHRVVAVTDPRVALERLDSGESFDLILSDVIMPGGMNGVDLAREIRRRWADLPILLVTGFAEDSDAILQEFPMLHKPFTTIELTQTIKSLFGM
ncbi:hybrid sensor histidine kinase/response regulator [Sabulicella rubraurantiaca]|uniref:hybrid sensor histidine kinase/response regulator n=1 Tax=Sabulicella rubraurantiaca TaxID=2811429 RepID=UPI001A9635E7|nr:PAS domain-containing sensor histidine kinase [Sabulicella rubraurantiaca]